MIIFSGEYVQMDKYPGYYWNVVTQQLYSCKTGVLVPLKPKTPWEIRIHGRRLPHRDGYMVSVRGKRKFIALEWLKTLVVPNIAQVFPEQTKGNDNG